MVVINYRLGDLVTLAAGACSCGRTLPLIHIGRVEPGGWTRSSR